MSFLPQEQVLPVEDSAMLAIPTTKQLSGPTIKYPPFPAAPEGAKIVPFKDFKEHGIQIFNGDNEVEVDGLGIPTVPLRVPHETDEGKTEARKKSKNPLLASHPPPPPPPRDPDGRPLHPRTQMIQSRKEWWQFWQEGEDLRVTAHAYNPNMTRMDRTYQAAADFRLGRPWPPAHTQILYLWDQFRIFVGLLGVTPVWTRTDRPQENADEDSISDDESDFEAEIRPPKKVYAREQDEQRKRKPYVRNRPPYTYYGKQPTPVDSDEAVRELLEEENIRKEEQLINFLNNPELTVKIFFSWYLRREGLIWSDRYLDALPRLVLFFLNFLLRNQVLPETMHERGLRKAVIAASQAFKELPLTSRIAKRLPDEFSLSCMACWEDETRQPIQEPSEADGQADDSLKQFEDELKAANMQIVDPNLTPDEDTERIAEDAEDGGVDPRDDYDPTAFKVAEEQDPWGLWMPPNPHSLMILLGPTAFPLTHTPGVIETSMRRIKSWTRVPQTIPKSAHSSEPDADAVETELQRRFAKVVMSPCVGWNDGGEFADFVHPKILRSGPAGKEGSEVKPHDPLTDDITLLIEPSILETMCEGIGIAGTWVQLARLPSAEKKKGKGKSKGLPTSYWYIQQLSATIPSFWSVPDTLPESI